MNESRMPFRIIITGTADALFAESIFTDTIKNVVPYNSVDIQFGSTATTRLMFEGDD